VDGTAARWVLEAHEGGTSVLKEGSALEDSVCEDPTLRSRRWGMRKGCRLATIGSETGLKMICHGIISFAYQAGTWFGATYVFLLLLKVLCPFVLLLHLFPVTSPRSACMDITPFDAGNSDGW